MPQMNLFVDAKIGRMVMKRSGEVRVALEIAYREPQPRGAGPVKTQAYTLELRHARDLAIKLRQLADALLRS